MTSMTLNDAMQLWDGLDNMTVEYTSDTSVSITTNVFSKTVHEQVDTSLTAKFNEYFDHPRGVLVTKAEGSFRCYFFSATNQHVLNVIIFFYNEEKGCLVRRHRDRLLPEKKPLSPHVAVHENDRLFIRRLDKYGGELLLEEKPFRMLHVTGSIQHQHLAV